MTGYNLIAPFYQFFVKLVFGNLLFKAQTHFLSKQLNPAQILIIGGGTGELLAYCLQQFPLARISYVESSKKMIELSHSKISNDAKDRVDFQCKSVFNWNSKIQFDLVLIPFVLDLFSDVNCQKLLNKIGGIISEKSKVVVTDFCKNPSKFQYSLVGFMYFLFNSVNASDRSSLPNFQSLFTKENWIVESEQKLGKNWYKDLVVTYQLMLCNTI